MTHVNQNRPRSVRSKLERAIWAAVLTLPLGCALPGGGDHVAQAQTRVPGSSCGVALDGLMARWQSIGFTEPSKPAQQIVAGRNGTSTSGGQFNYMRTQIRAAAQDCDAGRDADAMRHIDTVSGILDRLPHI
jgi:hypothetical protein